MMNTNKEIIKLCMQKGYLLDKSVLEKISLLEETLAKKLILTVFSLNSNKSVLNKNFFIENSSKIFSLYKNQDEFPLIVNFFESLGILFQEQKKQEKENSVSSSERPVKVVFSPNINPKKVSVQDFVSHFKARYNQLKSVLLEKNLDNLRSLRRIGKDRENYYIIVCVMEKRITKNGNIILDVEDINGSAKVLINNNKKELFVKAKDILVDEVIALSVSGNNELLFANDIIYPDVVISEKKKLSKDEIAAFISDIHIGSTMFLEKEFIKFIDWLNLKSENQDQVKLAKKVKYLFIVGDTVDGVGVYPGQEKFLNQLDFLEQYKILADLLKMIRSDIEIIISPGQHDAVWVGEPQPAIDEKWAPDLFDMDNVTLVPNPCVVQIRDKINVLMYHGASMHGIIEEIEEIRTKYGHNSPTRVSKEMLKRRHLSPMHGNCDYIPGDTQDPMVISTIPDIFCTGDQHRPEVSSYNGVLLIASSCWQKKTPFEEKVGNEPDPCKVPIVNLKTREVKILDFS